MTSIILFIEPLLWRGWGGLFLYVVGGVSFKVNDIPPYCILTINY